MTVQDSGLVSQPLLQKIRAGEPVLWLNPLFGSPEKTPAPDTATVPDIRQAADNWRKLAPLLKHLFPELAESNGSVESELIRADALGEALGLTATDGRLFVKGDHALPVAGSVKARGGIYEVCMAAWSMARRQALVQETDSSVELLRNDVREFFSTHRIAVGSTGNLGLSVGLTARALGFATTVHMSHDAKPWKVQRLTSIGAEVIQHRADYANAVARAREQARNDPDTYFVDDEQSRLLFEGYSTAAIGLQQQLAEHGVSIDADNPLFLYLPCGIGGAPGGITYGAHEIFGNQVHCFMVEPVQSPCALVQMASGSSTPVSVHDFGLTNRTEADGMAVAQVSQYVVSMIRHRISGSFTVRDQQLFHWLQLADQTLGIRLEPSAAASFGGPSLLTRSQTGQVYLHKHRLNPARATHVLWATGGALVPEPQYRNFLKKAATLAHPESPVSNANCDSNHSD